MKGLPTPRRRDAVTAQRANGTKLREQLQTQLGKVQAAADKRRRERIAAKQQEQLEAGHTPTRVAEWVSEQPGSNHAQRRRRQLQRRSDARANRRYEISEARVGRLDVRPLIPPARVDRGALIPGVNTPHVDVSRDVKPGQRLRAELREKAEVPA